MRHCQWLGIGRVAEAPVYFDHRAVPLSRAAGAQSLPLRYDRAMDRRYRSFAEFWPYYLREHSRPRTRALHYAGTTLVVAIAVAAVFTGRWLLFLALPLAGYGFAWVAHFRVEKNRPATFTYPLWSLAADFRMWWLWLSGRIGPELERAGVARSR